MKDIEKACSSSSLVLVRSTDFGRSPTSQTARQLGAMIKNGARKTVVEDSDWRALMAFPSFQAKYADDPGFALWQKATMPLGSIPAIQEILQFKTLPVCAPKPTEDIEKQDPPQPVTGDKDPSSDEDKDKNKKDPTPRETGPFEPFTIGQTTGRLSQPEQIDPALLNRHAAFLGGSGSGKTTFALAIIEKLLLRGIPAILIDRKGDLAAYATEEAWAPTGDAERDRRLNELRSALDIALYTPGQTAGRPLRIDLAPPLPEGSLPEMERNQIAKQAAQALGGMLNFSPSKMANSAELALILGAIEVALAAGAPRIDLENILELIAEEDPSLVNAVGHLNPKMFSKTTQLLEVLRLNQRRLFNDIGEPLNAGSLFGLDNDRSGRTRLSIIYTGFLGDNGSILFWVTQLLMELNRFIREKPSKQLQAVVMFDEADLYLPATSKPSTKVPLEGLLKRGRSAGLGIFLATQNPGDLDPASREQITSWFLGRIQQTNSLNKLKPLIDQAPGQIASKLPQQKPGQFQVIQENRAFGLQAERSLVRANQVEHNDILDLAQQRRS